MRDPIELYEYPKDWVKGKKNAEKKIAGGLYILSPNGWIRRGITTATTATAALLAALSKEDVDFVNVKTPIGLVVKVPVMKRGNFGIAVKFSGDHAFDSTSGAIFIAKKLNKKNKDKKIIFGENIGSVSEAAKKQLSKNFEEGVVFIDSVFRSKKLKKIAILGTTGFVEPWCDELLKTKTLIAKQYEKIAVTTGRESWKVAREVFPDFQPFVFGIHLKEIVASHEGEIVIVGKKGLIRKIFGSTKRDEILREVRKLGDVLEVFVC